ncbi:MAG: hypothetical protein JNL98_35950 [Bryobacterales bacterium]|nr:hypothetical protein [Bryobacterales bacterium]
MRANARNGHIWMRQTADGLLIAGSVSGGTPEFASSPVNMLSRDHVEIWLSAHLYPPLPPIGWGNQFGMIEDKTAEDCQDEKCRDWYRRMARYRPLFERLFVRQYQLAPNVAVESYASPAYQQIRKTYADADTAPLAPLAPKAIPRFRTAPAPDGYTFEALVPWAAFPPLQSLSLDRMRVLVDVFRAHAGRPADQPFSSTATGRRYGFAATYNDARFVSPRKFRLGACAYPLTLRDIYFESLPGWFLPSRGAQVQEAFVIQNTVRGYLYEPGGLSPVIRTTRFFERRVAEGEYVCGPELAWRDGEKFSSYSVLLEPERFDARKQSDGSVIVKAGPVVTYSEFGSGMCGACPRVRVDLVRLVPNRPIEELWKVYEVVDNGRLEDIDVHIAADWRKFTIFRLPGLGENEGNWQAEDYCRVPKGYAVCGTRANVRPPSPRVIDLNQ